MYNYCALHLQEAFYKVDHDYVVDAAKIAADGGCEHFHLVSSKGASAGSSNLYLKTKVCSVIIISILLCAGKTCKIFKVCFSYIPYLAKHFSFVSKYLSRKIVAKYIFAIKPCTSLTYVEL